MSEQIEKSKSEIEWNWKFIGRKNIQIHIPNKSKSSFSRLLWTEKQLHD